MTAGFENEKLELESLLAAGVFNRAPNLANLLQYVCSKHFEGTADQIKEYNIAVEALGRPADFDPKRDSIVRVEAHRLRKRLKEFYEADGAGHAVKIDIPPGQYVPRFLLQESAASEWMEGAPPATTNGSTAPAPIPPAATWRRRIAFAALISLAALGILAAWLKWPARLFPAGAAEAAATLPAPLPATGTAGERPEIRIRAGYLKGPYTDRLGRVWQSDRYFKGGWVFDSANHPVLGTRDPRLYETRREGSFSYDIPLPPGIYELRLHFAETLYGETNAAGGGETSRLFNIYINGNEVLDLFDVIADAGANEADIRAFKDISPAADGKLHLNFQAHTNLAFVDGIEVTPGIPGRFQPIRMVARDHPYIDKEGVVWEPDRYASGGQLVVRSDPVAGDGDPELFRGERFGNIRYVIPVPPGKYAMTFYFAETWFGPGMAAGGGAGSRLFDILVNGVALRRNFDIFKEAHGNGNALQVSTHGMSPNSQGKLVITLEPVRNYACVNAIEIVDESK